MRPFPIRLIFDRQRRLILLLGFVFFMNLCEAATYYSKVTTGNFNAVGSWTADTTTNGNAASLTSSDIFIIRNGHTITLNANMSVGQVIIRSGGTLSPNNTRTLTNTDPVIIQAGGTLNLTTRNMSFGGDLENDGTITGTSGQVTMGSHSFTNNGSFTVSTGRINTSAGGSVTNNGTITMTSSGRILLTDGSMLNNGTITMAASSQITKTTGTITNSASGTITITGGTATITMGTGDFINNNTSNSVDFASSNVIITGTSVSQQIGGFITNGRVSCTKTAGTVYINGDINCNGLTMNGSGGTMDLGTAVVTTVGTVVLSAGTLYGNASTINVNVVSTSAWGGSNAGVFDPGTSTVVLGAAGAQRLSASGTKTFYNLSFANSGLKTDATTVVNGTLSMEGTATASAAPTYGPDATLQYNTATSRTSGVEWITPFAATGGVVIANTGTITPDADKVFSDGVPLTINSGAVFDASGNNMSFGGNLVNNGTWTPSTGNIIITGAATQSIGNFSVTGDISMTKTGGTATMTGNMNGGTLTMNGSGGTLNLGTGLTHTITGDWTNTAGSLSGGSSTLNIGGTSSGTGISFTANTGTVNYTGSGAEDVAAFTYYDLGFSGTGLKSLTGNTGVGHVLTINTGSELNLGALTLDLSGGGTPLVNNGVLTTATSTVLYSSASSALIAAEDYYDLDGSGGDRTLSSSGTIGIGNSFTPGAGTYIVTGSTVDFNGTGSQNLPAFTFYYLDISNTGIKYIPASTIVQCQTITLNGSIEISSDTGGRLYVLQ